MEISKVKKVILHRGILGPATGEIENVEINKKGVIKISKDSGVKKKKK